MVYVALLKMCPEQLYRRLSHFIKYPVSIDTRMRQIKTANLRSQLFVDIILPGNFSDRFPFICTFHNGNDNILDIFLLVWKREIGRLCWQIDSVNPKGAILFYVQESHG